MLEKSNRTTVMRPLDLPKDHVVKNLGKLGVTIQHKISTVSAQQEAP
jgi:hypothetical protein